MTSRKARESFRMEVQLFSKRNKTVLLVFLDNNRKPYGVWTLQKHRVFYYCLETRAMLFYSHIALENLEHCHKSKKKCIVQKLCYGSAVPAKYVILGCAEHDARGKWAGNWNIRPCQIGRAHVWTPVTPISRMPSSAWKKKKKMKKNTTRHENRSYTPRTNLNQKVKLYM